MSLTNNPLNNHKTKLFPKFPWTRVSFPEVGDHKTFREMSLLEDKSLNEMKAAIENGNVAAIIIEPIQGEGGDRHCFVVHLENIRQLADEHDALFIIDEVQTGMGLTGKMWAYEHFGIKPDILCFGKKAQTCGISCNNRIDDVDNVFKVPSRINSTWGGNIVDMVRASIIIEIIKKDELVKNAEKVGRYFLSKLINMDLPNARGRGLMIAFDTERRDEFLKRLKGKGVLALSCGENSVRFRPHLTITKEEVDFALEAIKAL